jgi:hypothetical protein
MRFAIKLIFFFFLFSGCAYGVDVTTTIWQINKSTHFIVYYREAPSDYVNEIINQSESYYNTITEKLGFTRYEEFWTWYRRAKIYLFKDKEEYQRITSQPEWSAGGVRVLSHEIYTYIRMDNFFNIILPHELGHIIFREFIGYGRKLPLWLDEGVATYCEKGETHEGIFVTRTVARTCFFMDLNELGEVTRVNLMMPDIFYAEAASLIEFLLKVYGKDKFLDFCRALRELREDQSWKVALFEVYKFNSMEEMNRAWIKFIFSYS